MKFFMGHSVFPIRLWLGLGLFLLLHLTGFSQRSVTEDVVYLKNGSMLRGKIVSQEIGKGVRIRIMGGSEFFYEESEIEKITIEPLLYRRITLQLRKELIPFSYRDREIYHIVSFDLGFAEDEWGLYSTPNLRYRTGYHFKHYLSLGLGSGFDFYDDATMIIPLVLDVRGDLAKKPVTPHYAINIGYGFPGARGWDTSRLLGGINGQFGAGLKFHTRRKHEWMFTGGFRFQQTYQEFNIWNDLPEPILVQGNFTYNRVFFEMAFGF